MNVTHINDYRDVIRAWMAVSPTVRTQGLLARRTGRSSASVSMILQRKRALNPDDADNFGAALRLSGEDLPHFIDLVRMEHGTEQERREATERVRARQTFARRTALPLDHEVFAKSSTWAVLALVECVNFRPDPAWVGSVLRPPLSAAEAQEAMDHLVQAGILTRQPDGSLAASDAPIAIADEEVELERWNALHAEQLDLARAGIRDPGPEKPHVVGVVAALPSERLGEIAVRLEAAIREVLVVEGEEVPDQVYQISFQIMPRSVQTR